MSHNKTIHFLSGPGVQFSSLSLQAFPAGTATVSNAVTGLRLSASEKGNVWVSESLKTGSLGHKNTIVLIAVFIAFGFLVSIMPMCYLHVVIITCFGHLWFYLYSVLSLPPSSNTIRQLLKNITIFQIKN